MADDENAEMPPDGVPGKGTSQKSSPELHTWREWVFQVSPQVFLSIFSGFVILAIGLEWFGGGTRYHALLVFCGVGLILGALTANSARAEMQGIIIGGSAAVAVGLTTVFLPKSERFVLVEIAMPEASTNLLIYPNPNIIQPHTTQHRRSIVMFWEKTLQGEFASLQFTIGANWFGLECIPLEILRDGLGDGTKILEWGIEANVSPLSTNLPNGGPILDPRQDPKATLFNRRTQTAITSNSDRKCKTANVAVGTNLLPESVLSRVFWARRAIAQENAISAVSDLTNDDVRRRFEARQRISLYIKPGDVSSFLPYFEQMQRQPREEDFQRFNGIVGGFNDTFSRNRQLANQVFGVASFNGALMDSAISLFGIQPQPTQNEVVRFVANVGLLNIQTARSLVPKLMLNITNNIPNAANDPMAADSVVNSIIIIQTLRCTPHTRESVSDDQIKKIVDQRDKVGVVTNRVIDRLRC